MRFKKEWNHGYAHRSGYVCGRPGLGVDEIQQTSTNAWMENRFQIPPRRRIPKRDGRQRRAVDPSIRRTNARAEACHDWIDRRAAHALQLMHHIVRVQKLNAKFPEELGKQTLPTGDTACQGYTRRPHQLAVVGAGVTPASFLSPVSELTFDTI